MVVVLVVLAVACVPHLAYGGSVLSSIEMLSLLQLMAVVLFITTFFPVLLD